MMNYYDYLNDKHFLSLFDLENHKTQFVRIQVLDFYTEATIAYIEGKTTGGNINLNGSSNMRRTMSCSLLADFNGIDKQGSLESIPYIKITEISNLISMNKKVSVSIGFFNSLGNIGYYSEHDIIWFPQGIYTIKSASIAKSTGGTNISLTLNDKTSLLNGDVGGTIPAATIFSENELYSADASTRTTEKILIKDIIKHLVVDFGGEKPENVIIENIPATIRKVMKWTGHSDLYYYEEDESKFYDTNLLTNNDPKQIFSFGQDCGYMIEPFCYPGTLECNAGDTVASVLDKIKNTLGNFEWFYDIWGRFHFQEKKNYINTSHATTVEELTEANYLSTINLSKTVYEFNSNNKKLLTNISNAPQYQNVKNDFIVWGSTKTISGATKPIRYHLSFDKKPKITTEPRLCIVYFDYRGLQQAIVLKENKNMKFVTAPLSNSNKKKDIYYLHFSPAASSTYIAEHWDEDLQMYRLFPEWEVCYLQTDDWRTELYFLGLENNDKSFAKNYYAAELNAEWPKIYNIKAAYAGYGKYGPIYKGAYRKDVQPYQYEYFLDFIEGSDGGNFSLSQFNVNNIGRRTKVGKDKSANCIFSSDIPNCIFNLVGTEVLEWNIDGYDIINVDEDIYNNLSLGGTSVSAYDKVKELLVQHTHYNEAITLTTIPIYYLEPNTRIHIEDTDLGISGDYMINTISLPLGIGTSNISCTKCIENTI